MQLKKLVQVGPLKLSGPAHWSCLPPGDSSVMWEGRRPNLFIAICVPTILLLWLHHW